jgi:hypothetical protein
MDRAEHIAFVSLRPHFDGEPIVVALNFKA